MNIVDLIIHDKEKVSLDSVFLDAHNREQLEQLIKEYRFIEELHQYGLPVSNKVLLQGSSGCGKTMSSKAIANALGKDILILNLSNIISARVGETSQHLKQVFDKAAREKAVLFLDEFDQIGKARGSEDKDVGEMRRLVNTIIQLMDYYPEKALLICATNHPEVIDSALIRRFQLRISYEMPTDEVLDTYYDSLLSRFPASLQLVDRKYGISFAEAQDHCFMSVKTALLKELEAGQLSSAAAELKSEVTQ